jgi:dihydroflavonol-4-reductase
MVVCVTGGTGFLGAHCVSALTAAGRRVRLLVRDPSTVEHSLTPLGVDMSLVEVRVGEVTDERAVRAAVRGADAVLHAAGLYSFDSRRRSDMARTNVGGTETVLGVARKCGVGLTVHVSSIVALFPARVLHSGSPVGRPREPYMASKAAAEVVAREHQRAGAPVAITYPSALLGPDDPKLGDQNSRVRDVLRGLMPIWPTGGFCVGDVRDTAQMHAKLLGGTAPGRHFGPASYLSTRDYLATIRAVTGRRLPAVFLPAWSMRPVGVVASALQRVWPWHIPAEHGAIYTCAQAAKVAEPALVEPRPVAETMRDTVRWLWRTGRLTQQQVMAR